MEEDSSRTISYQDASKSSTTEESKKPKPALPSPSRSPSADSLFTNILPAPANALGNSRIPNSQDSSADSGLGMDISVLQPPQVGGGKPMHFKRGPGRPRKDGAGKSPKTVVSHKTKKLSGLFVSTGGRGVRGRKKIDGAPFVGGTNSLTGSLGDLNVFNHESPPRFLNAEDTAESDSSSVASSFEKLNDDFSFFPEQWPGKSCALCNLGEKSMLGQGDLIRLEIPSGFDPQAVSKTLSLSSKNEKDNLSDRSPKNNNFFARRQKGVKIKRLTSQGSLECMNEPVDEVVGYAEEPDLNNIFDFSTGFYYVHVQCALWCDGVTRDDDGNFENLEREIVRALSQHCSHCGNLGAGITCKAPGCGGCFHFACAATSGGFQESSSRTTLCVSHVDLAVAMLGKGANCTVCDQPGNTSSLLMCCSCNNHYHSACLALNSDPTIRAGWQCPACKVCQACRQPGDDSKLLPCDACDKVYHIFCLRPALASCPKYSWKCKMCRICSDCGARTPGSGPSSRWHANFTVCDSCYQQRNKGLACPLCGKAYRHVAQKHMVQCHQCKKYVHDTCDPAADLKAYQAKKEQNPEYEYICSVCVSPSSGGTPSNPHPRVLLSIKRSIDKDEASSESSSLLNSFTLSQDSFLSPEDDSLPGTENSNDLIWAEKISSSLEEIRPPVLSVGRGKPLTGNFSKKKLGVGRPRSSDKQGVMNSASSRRQRISELQRKRGPKPKMRGVFGLHGVGLQRPPADVTNKCDEEPGVENRLVLCSSRDEFVLHQDVCVMCGAFGNDLEGRLISCAQCGQCYHPYCVNIRVTKVVLQKGWRCLDCTVCEGCGQRHDEARLILCDDCDISFHIYCMDPPLDFVPQGTWKCKWCVVCQSCGANDPGLNSGWHNNYTLCGPCASLCTCPVCKSDYTEGELIIRCERCNRWLHSSCDMINNENEAEKCADDDYQCVLCRPSGVLPPHLQPSPVATVKIITPPRSPELKSRPLQNFIVDGINLSEAGWSYVKSVSIDQPRKKRKKTSHSADMEAGILATIESVVSGSSIDARPEDAERADEIADKDKESNKKKQRNLQKLGIGGFIVRLRGPRFKDDDETGAENQSSQDGEKPKRKQPRKKIKNKIVESFPTYLQEAFFGKSLLDPCKDSDFVSGDEMDESISPVISDDKYVKLSADELKAIEQTKARQEQNEKAKANPSVSKSDAVVAQTDQKVPLKQQIKIEEEDDADDALQELLPLTSDLLDNDLVDTIMNEEGDMKEGLDDLQGVDSALGDDAELSLDHNGPDGAHKDELTDFLSSQFNLESGLPSMDSKDVEDIFKGVLTDESQESQDNLFRISTGPSHPPHPNSASVQPPHNTAAPQLVSQQQNIGGPVVIPTAGVQGSPGLSSRSQLQQSVQQGLASPISFPPPSPYHSEYSNSPQFSPAFSEPPSPWPTQVDPEQEAPSNYNQRSILKWEVDEALGLNATISAVLYANTNHPELKRDYPNWAERCKQIAKIWRGLTSEKRAPYLQKARENRAASRMQKSQQIPKDSKVVVGGGNKIGVSSLSQSPDTVDTLMKMSPSSSSSCSASGASSCEVLNIDSSGSSQLSNSTATTAVPQFSCTSISAALSSVAPVSVHSVTVSSCMMSNSNSNNNNHSSVTPINIALSHCKATGSNTTPAVTSAYKNNKPVSSCSSSPSSCSVSMASATSSKDSTLTVSITPKVEIVTSSRCPLGDQQIRVLTPSEIMRTLPTLSQETCSFNSLLDQDKIVNGPIAKPPPPPPPPPPLRGETTEERHWKQMQAYRQQQQQQQQIVLQEHRLQGNAMAQVQRQLGTDGPAGANDMNRQPLQVTTSNDMGMPAPQSSPHLQSPNSRQVFAGAIPANRPRASTMEMPPPSPSPHYSPRPGIPNQGGQPPRPPVYSRVPYMHSPRHQTSSPSDPYASSPMTPQPSSDPYAHPPNTPRPVTSESENFGVSNEPYQKMTQDQYNNSNQVGNEMEMAGGLSSPRPQPPPQGQETRQHLRDLLQRQQIKKMEQDQMSPGRTDLASPGTPRPVSWSPEDWQKSGNMEQSFAPRHQFSGPNSPQIQQQNHFRHPFLPMQGRMSGQSQQPNVQSPNRPMAPDFRGPQPNMQQPGHTMDPRFRLLLQQQQQQRMISPQQQVPNRPQMNFQVGNQQQMQSQLPQSGPPQQQHQVNPSGQFRPGMSGRNPLDPYDHLVTHQRSSVGLPSDGSTQQNQGPSMLAQQLGRPLNSVVNTQSLPIASGSPTALPQQSPTQLAPNRHQSSGFGGPMSGGHSVMTTQSDHQELPDSVTAELEKLEQEQHTDGGVEAEAGELVDMGIDDDELLGMGADFNILEYADPELDQAVGGEKTNILDNLDLEEEKEEEKEENKETRKKETEKPSGGKREPNVSNYSSLAGQIQGSPGSVMPKMEPVPVPPNSGAIPPNQPNYLSHQSGLNLPQQANVGDMVSPVLRPPQPPPPPYPVAVPPPPPYPGRPQMGIRNGGGLSMQSMSSMPGLGMGLKNTPMGMMNSVGLRPPGHHIPPSLSSSCNPVMPIQQRRPLLLQEQPLLLEDLLEQEKREQQRQGPGLMGAAPEEPLLSDFDFERLKADVLSSSGLPVSLSPPNVSGPVILPPPTQPSKFSRGMPSQVNTTGSNDWQMENNDMMTNRRNVNQPASEHSGIPLHPALAQAGGQSTATTSRVPVFPTPSLPAPPTPPEHIVSEQDRQVQARYEEWLQHQQQILSMQLKYYEPEVYKLRKGKKSLSSKQRQLRKNGNELTDNDQMELDRITKELAVLQKQLDQSRKQSRQHNLLVQDYQAKQAKRQLAGGAPQSQASPLGTSHSPLQSTPQSPIMSPSPSVGAPVASPLAHNSPMSSPMTLSDSCSLSQTSPRSVGPPMHHMDDRPFSPSNDGTMRPLHSPQNSMNMQNRMGPQQPGNTVRMGSPGGGGQQIIMQQGGNQLISSGPGMMTARGVNIMHQQRPVGFMDNQRMRMGLPPDQLRMMSPAGQRFPRMTQELLLRARGHQNQFQNPNQQVVMSPVGQQYSTSQRVPFPNQSPTGPGSMGMVNSLRSPLQMNSLGLGSPPGNQVMMGQNRVSPASSPMRRPSGSGSVGVASPLPDRPQSVENPLTPRSTGSGPHTPSSVVNVNCNPMDSMQHTTDHFMHDNMHMQDPNSSSHSMQNYGMYSSPHTPAPSQQQQTDYGGGGGGNSQVIPFPKFSWFDGPVKLGLKGGSPFSVVNGSPSGHSTNIMPEQGQVTLENSITDSIASVNQNHTNSTGNDTVDVNAVQSSSETSTTAGDSVESVSIPAPTVDQSTGSNVVKEIKIESVKSVATPVNQVEATASPSIMSETSIKVEQPEQPETKDGMETEPNIPSNSARTEAPNNTDHSVTNEATIKVEPMEPKPVAETETIADVKKVLVLPSTAATQVVSVMNSTVVSSTAITASPTITKIPLTTATVAVLNTASKVEELPPSSIHQANVGVLGGFRPKTHTVISQMLDQNRMLPIQTIQSVDPSKAQNSSMQPTPVSLASLVADAVNAASLPFPQVSKPTAPGTFMNTAVPLITVYSRPELKNVTGNQHSNLTAVLLTSPRLTTSVSTGGQTQGQLQQQSQQMQQQQASPQPLTQKVTQSGESQNALLKQLLQNTGCASMNQAPTDTASLLTSLAKARPASNLPVHTSHLSEAASRIPQPTPPVLRPQAPTGATQSPGVRLPVKIEVRMAEGVRPTVPAPVSSAQPIQLLQQQQQPVVQQHVQMQQPQQMQGQQLTSQPHQPPQQPKAPFQQQQVQQPQVPPPQLHQFQQQPQSQPQQQQQPTILLTQVQQQQPKTLQQQAVLPQQPSSQQTPQQPQPQQTTPGQLTVAISQQARTGHHGSMQQQLQVKIVKVEENVKPAGSEDAVEAAKESSNSSIKDVIDIVAMDKNSVETTVTESKRSDEDVKKAKRRQYQSKKRPSIAKESSTPKKRLRKGSKLEEDYDSYMESMVSQIRNLPPVSIMEPELSQNYNVCPVYGAGDYSKIHSRCYSLVHGDLVGTFGNATVNNQDYYNEQPFGPAPASQSPKPQPSYRGFYHQEFGAPKLGSSGSKQHLPDDRSPTPFRETDTPDTIISSSSPECVLDNSNMYPGLKLIDEDEDERVMHMRDSPVIPLFAPIPIRPVVTEQQQPQPPKAQSEDMDKENIHTIPETFVFKAKQTSGATSPLKDNGNVTVTLTLTSNAAEDINGVLRNLANVLSITAPQLYQVVERTITPPSQKLGLYTYKGKDGTEIVDIQSILNGTAKFCRQCDVVVLNNVIKKKVRDLPGILPQDSLDESDDLYFCSTTCFMQYAMTHGVTLPTTEGKAGAVVKHPSEGVEGGILKSETSKLPFRDSSRLTLFDHEINKLKEKPSGKQSPREAEKSLKRSLAGSGDVKVKEEGEQPPGKKWKGIKYKKWLPSHAQAQVKYKRPTEKEMTEMLFRMKITVAPAKMPEDSRRCMFCHQVGDGVSDGPGRLLNYDVDKWVHLNCSLWSEDVYETENGALMNVEQALKQSFVHICSACKQKGATVKCFKLRCSSVFHLGCAVKEGCVFYKNKSVYCSAHVPKGEKENELTTLSVFRRVYIHRDENRQVATVMHHADQHNLLRVGSLIFLNVGQLLPHQLQNFHTANFIYPVGYKIVRFYWSMKRINKRCQYICSIHEVDGKPEFRISPQEEGMQDVVLKSLTAQGAWHQVLEAIAKLRNSSNTIKVFPKYITGEDLFGLTEPSIVRVLESLPGIETLTDYHFKYGRNPLLELPLAINPTGCARSEPKLRTHFKRPHTQRTGSSSRSASAITSSSLLSSSEAVCPYSKQFVHSKSSQYKKMKQDWRNNVYLARSKIQGLGLYAARDIEKHTMVIEYIGEIIRSELAELREKKYEAQNRGIYMFRVDEDRVIDATLCGGLARYINHSCNPNCVAESVEVDRDWRIIIFANRRISRGEELAYDYKFEFEDDQHKIQCFCGAPNCRQWMN